MRKQNIQCTVAKYMRQTIATLPFSATLRDAVAMMIQYNTNGLVVVDDDRKVTGILSSWDIIQHIVPNYLEEDKHLASFEAGDVFAQRTREVANDPITKFMTAKVKTVNQKDTLMEAAALLSEFRIRQMHVVDDDGHLVGYINRTDIKRAVGDVLGLNGK